MHVLNIVGVCPLTLYFYWKKHFLLRSNIEVNIEGIAQKEEKITKSLFCFRYVNVYNSLLSLFVISEVQSLLNKLPEILHVFILLYLVQI